MDRRTSLFPMSRKRTHSTLYAIASGPVNAVFRKRRKCTLEQPLDELLDVWRTQIVPLLPVRDRATLRTVSRAYYDMDRGLVIPPVFITDRNLGWWESASRIKTERMQCLGDDAHVPLFRAIEELLGWDILDATPWLYVVGHDRAPYLAPMGGLRWIKPHYWDSTDNDGSGCYWTIRFMPETSYITGPFDFGMEEFPFTTSYRLSSRRYRDLLTDLVLSDSITMVSLKGVPGGRAWADMSAADRNESYAVNIYTD